MRKVLDAGDVQGLRDMSGFEFDVTDASGASIGRLTTGADGRTPTIDTIGGAHTITEVAQPSWADGLIDGGPITFDFEPGGNAMPESTTHVITYTNVVPTISITTAASDASDGDQVVDLGLGDAAIVDTVAYTALVPGTEYVVTGELMVRPTADGASRADASRADASGADASGADASGADASATAGADASATAGADASGATGTRPVASSAVAVPEMIGTGIVASTTFVPDGPDGSVDVVFTVPGDSPLLGHVVVVYQRLAVAASGRIVAEHADPDAVEQTIRFAEPIPTTIPTTAPTTAPTTGPPTVATPVPSPTTTTTTTPTTTTTTPPATTTPPTTSPPPAERSLPRTGGDGSRPSAAAGLAMLLLGLGLLLATVRAPSTRRPGVQTRPDM